MSAFKAHRAGSVAVVGLAGQARGNLCTVELLLNFVWLTVSLVLLGWKFRAFRKKGARAEWQVVVALFMLLLVLFPVISITDDLISTTAATSDMEHFLRRPMEPLDHAPMLALTEWVMASALVLFRVRQQRILDTSSRADSGRVRLLRGLVRSTSVRPPPVAAVV